MIPQVFFLSRTFLPDNSANSHNNRHKQPLVELFEGRESAPAYDFFWYAAPLTPSRSNCQSVTMRSLRSQPLAAADITKPTCIKRNFGDNEPVTQQNPLESQYIRMQTQTRTDKETNTHTETHTETSTLTYTHTQLHWHMYAQKNKHTSGKLHSYCWRQNEPRSRK